MVMYCPRCASPMIERETAGRIRPVCEHCGYIHYLNPVPTVGAVIEMEGGVVLIKRKNPPHQGRWAFPGGYVEADERLEEAVIREAEEETGLKVEIIELADVNSYPEGPPSSGVMIFYRVRPVGGKLQAGDDASEAKVFLPDEIPVLPFRTHREMMAHWLETQHGQTSSANAGVDTPRQYLIRRAVPDDAQQIIELARMIPINRDLKDEDWQTALIRARESAGFHVFVAQSTAQTPLIAGFVVLSVVRVLTGGYGFINDMAVLPTYRRQGIGAALMEAALRQASDYHCQSVFINADRVTQESRLFYNAVGFSEGAVMCLKLR